MGRSPLLGLSVARMSRRCRTPLGEPSDGCRAGHFQALQSGAVRAGRQHNMAWADRLQHRAFVDPAAHAIGPGRFSVDREQRCAAAPLRHHANQGKTAGDQDRGRTGCYRFCSTKKPGDGGLACQGIACGRQRHGFRHKNRWTRATRAQPPINRAGCGQGPK